MSTTTGICRTISFESVGDCILKVTKAHGSAKVEKTGNSYRISKGEAFFTISLLTESTVAAESKELAEIYNIPCQDCESRYEIEGYAADFDSHMAIFNEYLIINEILNETGSFFIIDPKEGKLMFE